MRELLLTLSAGLAASLTGFLTSSALLKYVGNRALVFYIPMVEETVKTFGAVIFCASVVHTHIVFGMVEALYDFYSSPSDYSLTASVLSLISHTLLGASAWFMFKVSGSALAAVLVSTVLHSLWNRIMTGHTG